MKKTIIALACLAFVAAPPLAAARGGPSEASAVSVLVTGSVVLAMSTLPLVALDSVFNASVGKLKPAANQTTDIEIRQNNSGKVAVIRVPDEALKAKPVTPGQKAELLADPNGHTLKIDDRPIAYVPGKSSDGLLHSQPVK